MPTLQFKGKSVIETYHHTVPHHRLEFDPKLSLLPKGEKPGLDGNLIIEGDNLLALKALLPTHAGKVKCIYIDPPYNTGNEGWVYNDNLTQPQFKEWIGRTVGKEGEDATRHDKWCCMMCPRLILLKELLRDDGAIFASIDDVEVAHLRLLLDEVFGPENFIATFIYHAKRGGGSAVNFVVAEHEYVLCFAKRIDQCEFAKIAKDAEHLDQRDERGPFRQGREMNKWGPGSRREDRPSMYFAIPGPKGKDVFPIRNDGSKGRWRRGRKKMMALATGGDLIFEPRSDGTFIVYEKIRSADPRLIPYRSILSDVGVNADGTRVLKEMFGKKVFESPKPIKLIAHLVSLVATDDEDIVLDSYAGSGTTAHAVLELSYDDDSERRFVLVQMKHDDKDQESSKLNLAREITAPRVRRAIEGYTAAGDPGTKQVKGLGGSFTYARVGDPLFSEYRDLGEKLPSFEDLAKYIFYTETSRDIDLRTIDPEIGSIGELGGTSYYLFYTPNHREDREASLKTLDRILKKDKNRSWVIYTERIWMHQEDLRQFERENKRSVRLMLVPFNLK